MLPELTRQAVAEALRWRAVTAGRFDPTVGAAVAAWQQGRTPVPQPERQVELDGDGRLRKWGPVALDLAGSAKGWAVDQAVAVLRQAGCTAALVNAGGDPTAISVEVEEAGGLGLFVRSLVGLDRAARRRERGR